MANFRTQVLIQCSLKPTSAHRIPDTTLAIRELATANVRNQFDFGRSIAREPSPAPTEGFSISFCSEQVQLVQMIHSIKLTSFVRSNVG